MDCVTLFLREKFCVNTIVFIENFKENRHSMKRKHRENLVSDFATGRSQENCVTQGRTELTITYVSVCQFKVLDF